MDKLTLCCAIFFSFLFFFFPFSLALFWIERRVIQSITYFKRKVLFKEIGVQYLPSIRFTHDPRESPFQASRS